MDAAFLSNQVKGFTNFTNEVDKLFFSLQYKIILSELKFLLLWIAGLSL